MLDVMVVVVTIIKKVIEMYPDFVDRKLCQRNYMPLNTVTNHVPNHLTNTRLKRQFSVPSMLKTMESIFCDTKDRFRIGESYGTIL